MNTYRYEDLEVGHSESFSVKVTEEALDMFKTITGDVNPLHNNDDYAKARDYKGRVAYGMLTASYLSTLAGVYLPGENSLIHSVKTKFSKPVYPGDTLQIEGTIEEMNDTFKLIVVKVVIKNQNKEKVLKGEMQIGVL